MSGIRISEFKKPATIIVDQAKVESAYGPKSSIQLETMASSFSKSGFTVEVKGLSRDSLLNGLFCVVPIQVRWRNGNAAKILPNQYPELQPVTWNIAAGGAAAEVMTGGHGNSRVTDDNNFLAAPLMFSYDNICVRPNPFKCIRNATLSINGSSFSTRTDAYYTAMSKLFADGRVEPITGAAYERYPYSNSGYRDRVGYQEGWFERCRSESTQGKVVLVTYNQAHQVSDLVIQYDVKFPIWFGPFTHLGFPGLSGFDGQTVSSLPYCNDIVFEATFTDNVIMDAFACSDDSVDSALSVANPSWQNLAHDAATDFMPDSSGIWGNCRQDGQKLAAADGFDCALMAPRLCYTFSEPDPDKMDIAPIYTLPSYRLITYEQRTDAAATVPDADGNLQSKQLASFKFPYIRLSNISSLYIVHAEPARVAVTGCIAGRKGRNQGAYNTKQLGMACANRTCPIKWDTVRVSMSTSSSVLSNFLDNYVTAQNQFELFKKYSGNAMALTFEQWKESSQMLIFSAEELCGIGAFANSFQSLTLSVEFQCYRDAADTKLQMVDFLKLNNVAAPLKGYIGKYGNKGANWAQTLIGRLICLEPELVSISEGAVSVEQVKLSQAEIHQQLMGGAPEVEDAPKLDELAR